MEPNRLEQEFKRKLDQRTIQPTEMAWDRLDAMLSVAEKKKPKKRTWMYVAASFLGFLLVGTLFLRQESSNGTDVIITKENTVVESPAPIVKEAPVTPSPVQEAAGTQETIIAPAVKQRAIASAPVKMHKKSKENSNVSPKAIAIDVPAGNEAVAAHNQPEDKSTVAEAEMLLAAADTGNGINGKKPLIKVNSNSLLSSVEGELNDNFRTKVLQTVAKNYNVIKYRNHQ